MYGKLVDGNLQYPPKHLKENGRYIANYDNHDQALIEDGYKVIEYSKKKKDKEGYYQAEIYEELTDKIKVSYEYREVAEDDL